MRLNTYTVFLCGIMFIGLAHSNVQFMEVDGPSTNEVPTTTEAVTQYTTRNIDKNVKRAQVFAMKRYYASNKALPQTTQTTNSSQKINYSFSISTTMKKNPMLFLTQGLNKIKSHTSEIGQPHISQIKTETDDISWNRLDLPGFSAVTDRVPCPTDRCYCQLNDKLKKYSIFCKYQKLGVIPANFNVVNLTYYEITFSAGNYITMVPYYAFRNLKVERINLLNNNLQSIDSRAFVGLESCLKELLLEGDRVIPAPYDNLSNLRQLRLLQLRNFQQDTIENENNFDQFPNLEVLQLYQIYTLTTLESQAFQNKLPNLKQLEFQNVYFKQLPVEGLTHLTNLQKLYIKQTPISAIYSQSFDKLDNLIDLDLSHNKIHTLEADTFVGLEDQLAYLDLTFNELKLESLVALSSKTWQKLEQLSLSYNSDLGNMPEKVFKGMEMLQYLSLVEINMKVIKQNTFFGLNNLHTLDLSWNKIEVIQDGAFQFLTNLYELRLNSQFQTYGHNMVPLSVYMNFSPASFQGIQYSLCVLNFEQTPFKPEQIWKSLTLFTKLEHLQLSETRIRQIPDFSFFHNTKLKTLELKQNNIDQLSQHTFSGLEQSLESIYMDSNNLSTISHCIFANFTNLDFLHLIGNKLHCDCRLKWLHKFITNRYGVVPYFYKEEFRCSTPAVMAYKYLADIPMDSLTCSDNVTEVCVEKEYTTESTTQTLTPPGRTPLETPATTDTTNTLTLTIAGSTKYSITVAWHITNKTGITGFRLVYYQTIDKLEKQVLIHKEEFLYTIHNLKPGLFYAICITAITNSISQLKDCRTSATESLNPQTNAEDKSLSKSESIDKGRNIVLGAIIGSIAFIILVAVGLYLIVKYKLQKLKDMQLSLSRTQLVMNTPRGNDNENDKICTIPNDYTDIETAAIAKRFQGSSSRQLNRQFGFDSTSNAGYESIRRFHRDFDVPKTENMGKSENNLTDSNDDNGNKKQELVKRYSAPSRLNVADLMRNEQAISRPLPDPPTMETSCISVYENHPQ